MVRGCLVLAVQANGADVETIEGASDRGDLAEGVALDILARRLEGVGRVTVNPFLVRLAVEGYEITIFPDGRAIVHGTNDPAVARTVYAKYVGG